MQRTRPLRRPPIRPPFSQKKEKKGLQPTKKTTNPHRFIINFITHCANNSAGEMPLLLMLFYLYRKVEVGPKAPLSGLKDFGPI
jgi:hypothetical protein